MLLKLVGCFALAGFSGQESANSTGAPSGPSTRSSAVTSVIFGARTLEQLSDNLAAAELVLTDAQMTRLDTASDPAFGYPYSMMKGVMGRW